jgi:hypothetical protein
MSSERQASSNAAREEHNGDNAVRGDIHRDLGTKLDSPVSHAPCRELSLLAAPEEIEMGGPQRAVS